MTIPENENAYSLAQAIVEEEEKPRGNFRLFRLFIGISFAILLLQLGQIQIAQGEYYRGEANRNRFRLIQTDALRGIVYDRNGNILVRNVPSFRVSIVPADLPDSQQERIFRDLSSLLNVPIDTIIENTNPDVVGRLPQDLDRWVPSPKRKVGLREILTNGQRDPFSPALVKTNVPREVAFYLEERHLDYPGVQVDLEPVREYVYGPLLSHILGYGGRIPALDLADYQAQGYSDDDQVGLTGLEYSYESELHGVKGRRYIEVDVAGREVALLGNEPPVPGHNLVLSIDLKLQQAAEAALRKALDASKSKEGVAIAIDPRNGQLRAMVTLPSYDDNLFATGISVEDYTNLAQDPTHPLMNHAISGQYPPGSTFKIIAASGALQEHVIDASTRLSTPGIIFIPNKFYPNDSSLAQPFFDWYKPGFGSLTVRDALTVSSDVFFYKVAGGEAPDYDSGLGEDRLAAYARLFGLGERSQIDLTGEAKGLVPDPTWKRKTIGDIWTIGDTYNMGIGQGFVLATPLQVANYTAVVANGGTLYKPQLVHAITDAEGKVLKTIEPQVLRKLPIDMQAFSIVREGMRGSATRGTGSQVNLAQVNVAAKTGTAEYYGPKVDGHLPTHAWFTAFAPYDKPEIVVTVFVAGGGEGALVAGPVAGAMLRAYFGLPPDSKLAPREPGPQSGNYLPAGSIAPPAPPARRYTGRLAGVDGWTNELPGVIGTVIDGNGRGVTGVRVALDKCDGNVIATSTTDGNGAFAFNGLNYKEVPRWCVRTVAPVESDPFGVDISPNKRYTIQFNPTQ